MSRLRRRRSFLVTCAGNREYFSVRWGCLPRYQEAVTFERGQTYTEYIANHKRNDEADVKVSIRWMTLVMLAEYR